MEISALGLGCMGMSFGLGKAPDRKEMIALLHEEVDIGVTFFDTAEVYGPYINEDLLGEALLHSKERWSSQLNLASNLVLRRGRKEWDLIVPLPISKKLRKLL